MANIGTVYLVEVINYICLNDKDNLLISNLDKGVYARISEKYNININTFKSNISKATNNMNNYNYSSKIRLTTKAVIKNFVYDYHFKK